MVSSVISDFSLAVFPHKPVIIQNFVMLMLNNG